MNAIEVESYRRRSETDLELLRRMVAMAQAETEWWQPSDGASYMVVGPKIVLGSRRYTINDEIVCAGGAERFTAEGECSIEQSDPTKRSLVFTTAYAHSIENVRFVGGSRPLHFENGNVDSTRLRVSGCEFRLSGDYAISGSRVGGAAGFLSASLLVEDCRFINCRKVLDTPFDSATFENSLVQWTGSQYMPENAAAFRVRENSNLYLQGFGVPCAGDETAVPPMPRSVGSRWVDLHGQGLHARNWRFGGEYAGMPIVYHYAPLATAYPWMGPKIVLEDCQLSAGRAGEEDSCVVYLKESVPQYLAIRDCDRVVDAPFIKKSADFNLDAWLDAKNVNNRIKLDISRAGMHWNDGYLVPPELLPFVC